MTYKMTTYKSTDDSTKEVIWKTTVNDLWDEKVTVNDLWDEKMTTYKTTDDSTKEITRKKTINGIRQVIVISVLATRKTTIHDALQLMER